jgi:hypothetical protein
VLEVFRALNHPKNAAARSDFRLTRSPLRGMNRADPRLPFFMLTIGSFAIAFFAVLAGVFWACLNDRDQT